MTPQDRLEFCKVQVSGWVGEIKNEADPKRIEQLIPHLIHWFEEQKRQEQVIYPQTVMMPGNTIVWDPRRFSLLKEGYQAAIKVGAETFTLPFAPGPILTLYGRYLVEYLQERFPHV